MRSTMVRVLVVLAALSAVVVACGSPASSPSLTGKTWQWTESTISEPAIIPQPEDYTIEFLADGTFEAKVDCNQANGTVTRTADGGMTLVPGPMTLVACPEGSLADAYLAGLGGVTSYELTSDTLVLTTATGTMTFK